MATVRQLAGMLGVSAMTISRALRGIPLADNDLREKILALAEEYHYRPNRLTTGLITGKTQLIGCLVTDMRHHSAHQLLRGAMRQAQVTSHHIVAMESYHDLERAILAVHTLIEQRVDGVVLYAGTDHPLPRTMIMQLWSNGIVPVSVIDPITDLVIDYLSYHVDDCVQTAVDYFIELGHHAIAYVGPAPQLPPVRRALARRKLSVNHLIENHVLLSPHPQEADALMDELWAMHPRPTAIFTHEDHIALQLMESAVRRGLRVPGDLSILGSFNLDLAAYQRPALTTFELRFEELGRRAVEMILRRITEDEAPDLRKPERILLSPKLIIRETCGPPGR